jgi:hypothetical protein
MNAWPEVTTEQIVARLRMIVAEPEKWCETDRHFVEDAADEIERLRAELKAWQDAHRAHPDEFGGNPE